jgi:hypothetical protein
VEKSLQGSDLSELADAFDPMLRDSETDLLEAWLGNGIRNDDPSNYEWLAETAQSNPKLLRVARPAVSYLGLDPI